MSKLLGLNGFRVLVAVCVGALLTMTWASAAAAHDPIFLTDEQTTPDTGPYLPDGSISWALYGTVLSDGDTRGFEFDLRDGDELLAQITIPKIEPEISLTDDELFTLAITRPDGTIIDLAPEYREIFDEPFSRTSYVILNEVREPAQAGRYTAVVTGNAPARFSVAIGIEETFFTPAERTVDRPTSFPEIGRPLGIWYSTPPGEEPNTEALAAGEAQVDLDMIEEAMEDGGATAPDGALDPAEATSGDDTDADTGADAETDTNQQALTDDSTDDDGSSTGWVAPVVVALIAIIGAGLFLVRGRVAP